MHHTIKMILTNRNTMLHMPQLQPTKSKFEILQTTKPSLPNFTLILQATKTQDHKEMGKPYIIVYMVLIKGWFKPNLTLIVFSYKRVAQSLCGI